MGYIYKIINISNDKVYIGSTNNLERRFRQHYHELRHNKHGNSHLQRAFNRYGESNFIFELIEECSADDLINREQYWIDLMKSTDDSVGYNKNPIAGTTAGRSIEIIKKTINTRRKNTTNWHSEETKNKISQSKMGASHSEEVKSKISSSMKKIATNRSQSSYDKMALTKKGRPIPSLYKKVKCIELGFIFESIGHAAAHLNLQRTGISMVLNGNIRTTGGYSFERVK